MSYIDELGITRDNHARTLIMEKACLEVDRLRTDLAAARAEAERAKADSERLDWILGPDSMAKFSCECLKIDMPDLDKWLIYARQAIDAARADAARKEPPAKPRYLPNVLRAIIALAPDTADAFQSVLGSADYAAPENMAMWWQKATNILNREFANHPKAQEIAAIFNGRPPAKAHGCEVGE